MCLEGFEVSLVFGFSSFSLWDVDREGVNTWVYKVKFLVMDVVVPNAGEPIVCVFLSVSVDQLEFFNIQA
jgi:hypothetical protein